MSDICYNGAEEPQTAKGIVKINYKEDFEVVVELMAGEEPYKIGEVDDFEIKFQVGVATYSVGRKAGVWNRCELADENKVRCFLSKHKLHVGRLRVEVYVKTQDANFENGKRLHIAIAEGVVELVRENSRFDAAEIKAYMPMVLTDAYKLAKEHGYGGTQEEYYNTFSDITSLLGELRSVAENESQRVEAEKKRERCKWNVRELRQLEVHRHKFLADDEPIRCAFYVFSLSLAEDVRCEFLGFVGIEKRSLYVSRLLLFTRVRHKQMELVEPHSSRSYVLQLLEPKEVRLQK